MDKADKSGADAKSMAVDLNSIGELVENLKELRRWQEAVLDKLDKQVRALSERKNSAKLEPSPQSE